MYDQEHINYHQIAKIISYIQSRLTTQPTLNEIAQEVNLSPQHFNRLFTDWAGVSPEKFLHFISIQYAKKLLGNKQISLFDTDQPTALLNTGRLHDSFVQIESINPEEYKNLNINYSYQKTPFGETLIASTTKGICYMGFSDNQQKAFSELKMHYSEAKFTSQKDSFQQNILKIYNQDWSTLKQINLHVKGSNFQLKIWKTLLQIPHGKLTTYGAIAHKINQPKAARAVGTAIGSNPISFLIPCHRVIQTSGKLGGYMWGTTRKTAIIGWEASKMANFEESF